MQLWQIDDTDSVVLQLVRNHLTPGVSTTGTVDNDGAEEHQHMTPCVESFILSENDDRGVSKGSQDREAGGRLSPDTLETFCPQVRDSSVGLGSNPCIHTAKLLFSLLFMHTVHTPGRPGGPPVHEGTSTK